MNKGCRDLVDDRVRDMPHDGFGDKRRRWFAGHRGSLPWYIGQGPVWDDPFLEID